MTRLLTLACATATLVCSLVFASFDSEQVSFVSLPNPPAAVAG